MNWGLIEVIVVTFIFGVLKVYFNVTEDEKMNLLERKAVLKREREKLLNIN